MLVLLLMSDTSFLTTVSGKELEVATQVMLMLFVMASRRVSELEHLLTNGKPTFKEFADNAIPFDAVSTLKFCPKNEGKKEKKATCTPTSTPDANDHSTEPDPSSQEKKPTAELPVVALSRDRTSYADVVAIFGNLAILVQCKDLGDDSTLGHERVRDELTMGFRGPPRYVDEPPSHAVEPPDQLRSHLLECCGVELPESVQIKRCIYVIMHRGSTADSISHAEQPPAQGVISEPFAEPADAEALSPALVLKFNAHMGSLKFQLSRFPDPEKCIFAVKSVHGSVVLEDLDCDRNGDCTRRSPKRNRSSTK